MPLERLREFSGPVPKTETQRDWFLVIDKPVDWETWQKYVMEHDSVIVGALKFQNQLLPCLGFDVARHDDLMEHLENLTLDGAQAVDPFHLQLHVDKDRQLDYLNVVVRKYDFSLEAFAQKLTGLLPRQVVKSHRVLIQCSSWYKYAGEAILTEVIRHDIRGSKLAKEYISINSVIDPVRGQEFHAKKVIEDFPEELKLGTSGEPTKI